MCAQEHERGGEAFSFDGQAAAFDRRAGLPAPVARRVADAIIDLAESTTGKVLLDLGAGTGQIGSDLAVSDRLRYIGLDISRPMLATYRSKLSPGTQLIHADADGPWPIASAAVDAIFFARSLHLLSADRVAQEALRVSRASAVLIVGGVARSQQSLRAQMRDKMRALLAEHGTEGRARGSAARKLFTLLEARGALRLETVSTAWKVEERPIDSIDSWSEKSGLAGTEVPRDTKRAVLDALRLWARERFGDLGVARRSIEQYELQVLRLP